jgi:hypothetical protein
MLLGQLPADLGDDVAEDFVILHVFPIQSKIEFLFLS